MMHVRDARRTLDRGLRACMVFLFLCLSLGCLGATGLVAQPATCDVPKYLGQVRTDHLARLNAHRVRQDRIPLAADDRLNQVAQNYACLLAQTGHFDHIGPDGSTLTDRVRRVGYPFCRLAENLAKGQLNVAEVILGWAQSPGHAANMRNRSLRNVGFGVALVGDPVPTKALSDLMLSGPFPGEGPTRVTLVWVQVYGAGCD